MHNREEKTKLSGTPDGWNMKVIHYVISDNTPTDFLAFRYKRACYG